MCLHEPCQHGIEGEYDLGYMEREVMTLRAA